MVRRPLLLRPREPREDPADHAHRDPGHGGPHLPGRGPDGGRDRGQARSEEDRAPRDRKSTRLNSSHVAISYAVFCLKKKKQKAATAPMTSVHSSSSRQPATAVASS